VRKCGHLEQDSWSQRLPSEMLWNCPSCVHVDCIYMEEDITRYQGLQS
jgi:hypothetical protein